MNKPITRNLFYFILHFVEKYKYAFGMLAFLRVGYSLDALAIPYCSQQFFHLFEEFVRGSSSDYLSLVFYFFLLIFVIGIIEVSFRVSDLIISKAIPNLEADIRIWIVTYLQQYSYQFFLKHLSGDLSKRVDDLTKGISSVLLISISSLFPTICTIAISCVYFFYVNVAFAAVWCCCIVCYILIYAHFLGEVNRQTLDHSWKESILSGIIVDGFNNIFSIKLFSQNRDSTRHLTMPQASEKKAHIGCLHLMTKVHVIFSMVSMLFTIVGLATACFFYLYNRVSIGYAELYALFLASRNVSSLVWSAIIDLPDFFQEVGYCNQAIKLLQERCIIDDLPDAKVLRCKMPVIDFKNINFSYDAKHPLFVDQNITIEAGEKVGLVGFSGSGKSSLIHLLLRFADLQSGTITIDGQDIMHVTQDSLRAAVSFVPQEPILFHDSILENIRYGSPSATDEQVIACAKDAKCHDFITKFPDGYHTLVGERGSKLSGGQRQRIAIARAMLKDSCILILDEATSALDAMTEIAIQDSLLRYMMDKTTIVVSHRVPILSIMDRIIVLEHGKVVAQGSHDALLKSSPLYAFMCQSLQ